MESAGDPNVEFQDRRQVWENILGLFDSIQFKNFYIFLS